MSRVLRQGETPRLRTVGRLSAGLQAPAVAVGGDGRVWGLTAGGPPGSGAGSLFLLRPNQPKQKVKDMQAWGARHPDPYDVVAPGGEQGDLEGPADESNPYGVAAGPRGTALVADAANNSVWRVWPGGTTKLLARVRPRDVSAPVPSEAVTTSVAMAPRGPVFIGELRGGPGLPETSHLWRVAAGTMGAVCNRRGRTRGAARRSPTT